MFEGCYNLQLWSNTQSKNAKWRKIERSIKWPHYILFYIFCPAKLNILIFQKKLIKSKIFKLSENRNISFKIYTNRHAKLHPDIFIFGFAIAKNRQRWWHHSETPFLVFLIVLHKNKWHFWNFWQNCTRYIFL